MRRCGGFPWAASGSGEGEEITYLATSKTLTANSSIFFWNNRRGTLFGTRSATDANTRQKSSRMTLRDDVSTSISDWKRQAKGETGSQAGQRPGQAPCL